MHFAPSMPPKCSGAATVSNENKKKRTVSHLKIHSFAVISFVSEYSELIIMHLCRSLHL